MTWLVTGGAGYIGSHVVAALLDAGLDPVVVDDFSTGRREFVPAGVPVIRGSTLDGALLLDVLADRRVRGVVHVAGYKYAGESVRHPLLAYAQNVEGTRVLLAAMAERGVDRLVFSSSAAVYGTPATTPVREDAPTAPESPYGETKLIGEWLIRDQGAAVGLRHVALRYFNVVGSALPGVFDVSPHNLFPRVFDALLEGRPPTIHGDDFPTDDGTAVRDYVHVADLAAAHVAAARRLDAGEPTERVYNLGSGSGQSVREVLDAVRRVTGADVEPEVGPRRPGDPARIVASGDLAERDLDWRMRHTLDEMVASAWEARRAAG